MFLFVTTPTCVFNVPLAMGVYISRSPRHLHPQALGHHPPLHHNPFRQLYIFEAWPTRRERPGPITPMLHRSITNCTLQRRRISLDSSSVRYYMVRRRICYFIRPHYICSTRCSRDCYRSVLRVYERVAPSHQSRNRGHQVGTRSPHRGHVLVRDDIHRAQSPNSIDFLHR